MAGERLSAWLLRNVGPNAYTTALHWTVEAESALQTRLKQAIFETFKSAKLLTLPEAERAELLAWVQAMAGPDSGSPAESVLKVGAYTLGASLLNRSAVGLARPYEEQGNAQFESFKSGALQSGDISNYVSLAFALATPFAQKHDIPWL